MRKEDPYFKIYDRSDRLYQTESGWFFSVRQGAAFGPYESQQNAKKNLASFVEIIQDQSIAGYGS
ncbi:hypothetical protein FLL45_09485 [Aliikangiella marina]|uniref:DUF6316 domain-containing protein n=1 Tax=Aliikangiella marina TaxID=1712262 RepID=A0A545TD66_9GAMM|nr:DUF6316 family protein [Aliikangiella marina]TQV75160.1 hypothetical protein FLL45_09485 [Aliikangiella marina]